MVPPVPCRWMTWGLIAIPAAWTTVVKSWTENPMGIIVFAARSFCTMPSRNTGSLSRGSGREGSAMLRMARAMSRGLSLFTFKGAFGSGYTVSRSPKAAMNRLVTPFTRYSSPSESNQAFFGR